MIAVVGGGVIGLSAAYYLAKSGADVVLFERASLGRGCTWGSAGWITPSESAPVVGPKAVWQALHSLGRPSSPLYLRPTLDPGLYRWLVRAVRYCNSAAAARGLAALADLGRPTFGLYDELERAGLAADMTTEGLLHVFAQRRSAAKSLAAAAVMRSYGYEVPDDLLTGGQLRELEPTLSRRAEAGYLIGGERHVDPARLTAGLATLARKSGAEVHEQTEVTHLDRAGWLVRAVTTSEGSLPVDGVVLAGGASSGRLLRPHGVRLPLTAGKGYSFLRRLRVLPRRPIHLGDIKVAVTPFARGLRVAGTMELSGNNDTLHRSRVDAIAHGTAQYFSGWDDLDGGGPADRDGSARESAELWVGRRPLTPDGLPILDRVHPFENLYLATGHSMLGITLAPASAKALTDYVVTGNRPEPLEPFRLDRFGNHRKP
ncbi:MAG TPA: FAD-dependent oxidoreductase [Streptosporangiaceae bacterium]|nr:FAD-dependent oxidoreductase [Streptosporangiaceae bacterium]